MKKIQIKRFDKNYVVIKVADYQKGGWRNWRVEYALNYREGTLLDGWGEIPEIKGVKFLVKGKELNKRFCEFVVAEGKILSQPIWRDREWRDAEEGEIEFFPQEKKPIAWLADQEEWLEREAK